MILSSLYRRIIELRNRWYDRSPGRSYRTDVPVVSVGNLTSGGTGKTPMTILVMQTLQAWGYRPAILTRGYMPKANLPSDEVAELKAALPGVRIVVNPDRVEGAKTALAEGADALVLDDGFQHRRLARCFDLVLIDATCPFRSGEVLPWQMREPISSLKRAGGVVLTRCNQAEADAIAKIEAAIREHCTGPLARATVEPSGVLDAAGHSIIPRGQRVMVVCAVGNPESVLNTVSQMGLNVVGEVTRRDHYVYTPHDYAKMQRRAQELDAEAMVTTMKDWVKLANLCQEVAPAKAASVRPVWRIPVRHVLKEGGEALLAAIRTACYAVRAPKDSNS